MSATGIVIGGLRRLGGVLRALGLDVLCAHGLRRHDRIIEPWLRFVTVRESNARVYHRATGELEYPGGGTHVACQTAPIKALWHFRSARGEGWGRAFEPCASCETAWEMAGSPAAVDRVPAVSR